MPLSLNRRLINRFFKILSSNLEEKARVILTGAAAGNLLGDVRPSNDIDFAINFGPRLGGGPQEKSPLNGSL